MLEDLTKPFNNLQQRKLRQLEVAVDPYVDSYEYCLSLLRTSSYPLYLQIEGIPDDESVPEQFEIAEDAMLSAQLIDDNEDVKPVNLPSSAPTRDVSHSIKRIDILSDEISWVPTS